LNRADKFYSVEKLGLVLIDQAFEAWEVKKSVGYQIIAALSYYGLIETQRVDDGRWVKLSDLALSIIRDKDPNSEERKQAIKEAALRPKVFSELWKIGPGGRIPDEKLLSRLRLKMDFTDEASSAVVKTYRKVLAYSGLDKATDGDLGRMGRPEPPESQGGQGMAIAVEDSITIDDKEKVQTYTVDLPFQVKGKTSRFSLKIPYPMDWSDWERMRGILDSILGEVIPGKPENQKK
jgi:hypothetical protein